MDLPRKQVTHLALHEWVIGEESRPTDKKTFTYGFDFAVEEIRKLGVDMSMDNAFYVRAGEGGEVIVYIKIEGEVQHG